MTQKGAAHVRHFALALFGGQGRVLHTCGVWGPAPLADQPRKEDCPHFNMPSPALLASLWNQGRQSLRRACPTTSTGPLSLASGLDKLSIFARCNLHSTAPTAAASSALDDVTRQVEQLTEKVHLLEAAEACRSTLARLLMLVDSGRHKPDLISALAVAEMFTPAARVEAGSVGSAESQEQVLPLLQRLAKAGGQGRQHTTNIVTEPSSHDRSIMKATAYSLVVEPVAGAKPVVTSLHTLESRLEKGLDDKWRIKRLSITEAVGRT